ncbi:MAG: hypothetical protein Q9205_003663 [Flavoplaca limonia]
MRSLWLLQLCVLGISIYAQAHTIPPTHQQLSPRVSPSDSLYRSGKYCDGGDGIDVDVTGLGVRIGLYLQCLALSFTAVTGLTKVVTAIPAALMTVLVINVILTMKAVQTVFKANPVIQDFWVAHTQLFLLTSIVPFTMLFGQWKNLGITKNTLSVIALLYTYFQALWFWFEGYKAGDEVVCDTAESSFGNWKLFSHNARWAMLALYLLGLLVILPFATVYYIRGKPGIFSCVMRKAPIRRLWAKALLLLCFSVPLYLVCIWMVENTVRKGSERRWLSLTGQWFSLGIGTFTLVEALWHTCKCVWSELNGGVFTKESGIFGGHSEPTLVGGDSYQMTSSNDGAGLEEEELAMLHNSDGSAKAVCLRRNTA